MGLYEREVRFYTDIAPGLQRPGRAVPSRCLRPGDRRLRPAARRRRARRRRRRDPRRHSRTGDAGADPARPRARPAARRRSAGGRRMAQPRVAAEPGADRPRCTPASSTATATEIAPEHREVCERLVATFDAYLAAEAASGRPQGLVHGDYRLDNMLFGEDGADRPLTVVDWQTVTWGPALTDVAYFLGCALPVEQRREHYDALLRAYHDALGPDAARQHRRRPRRRAPPELLRRDDGDRVADARRAHRARRRDVHDDDRAALPARPRHRRAGRAARRRRRRNRCSPTPTTRARTRRPTSRCGARAGTSTSPTPARTSAAGCGSGLIPNQGHAWINALLCGPDMPTIAVLDFEAAAAGRAHRTCTPTASTSSSRRPSRCRPTGCRCAGRGEAYDDPADLLRGEPGRPVDVDDGPGVDDRGTPYQYRLSPRYEIPCTVSGTVTRGRARSYEFAEVAGQRDHSWAARDWWGMDWVWSALHLDDGTHIHGVDLRIPGAPPIGVGYVQRGGRGSSSCRPSSRGRRSATTSYPSAPRSRSRPATSPRPSTSAGTRRCC